MKGQCSCGEVQYEMTASPLFVHACHCTNCQRQSGSAHTLNAMIETSHIKVLAGAAEGAEVETGSGAGQVIYRCPSCKIGLWSHYNRLGKAFTFVRVGTLENPSAYPPDINIFTKNKQPWVTLRGGVPATEEFYDPKDYWPAEALQRMQAAAGAEN